jgi:hypothetical protein
MAVRHDLAERVTGLSAAAVLLAACNGAEVSAGSEGDAINLTRCFGANCGVLAKALQANDLDADACGEVAGALEEPVRFEPVEDSEVFAADEAPDGSVWALLRSRGVKGPYGAVRLAHFSEDGALVALSEVLASERQNASHEFALTVDTSGAVTVGDYHSYAPDADSDVLEELSLYEFGSDPQLDVLPRLFRGMATPRLFGAAAGSVWIAGNAAGNATHGVVSRVTDREPDWIQTAVPSAGQGVGALGGLTVADDGFAAVVARSNGRWSGSGPNVTRLVVSTFDGAGVPQWTLELPTDYTAGYSGSLGGTADGDLVVAGAVGENGDSMLVRQLTREGELGWGYRVESTFGGAIEVKRQSGRTLVSVGNGVAVIDGDGARCRKFMVPQLDDYEPGPHARDPGAEYFLGVGDGIVRFRIPE